MKRTTNRRKNPEYRGLPLHELVSNPLLAVVKANERMAVQQVKFLLETCFYERHGVYHPVLIVMSITRGGIQPSNGGTSQIDPVTMDFSVPLITILPLNTLGVEETTVDFSIDVTSYFEVEADLDEEGRGFHPGAATTKSQLVGRIGRDHELSHEEVEEEVSDDTNISVEVVAVDMPLPKGVVTLLDAYSKAIYPTTEEPNSDGDW